MEKVYFISDIHLGAGTIHEEELKLNRLISFFNYINQPGNRLYIVGDLFDFWFEYNSVVPNHYFKHLFEIHKLTQNGVEIHFLPGNHDCWIKNFLSDQMNIQIHPEKYQVEYNSKKIHLFHGDGISSKDIGYQILKKIFRNPVNIFLYRLIHPDFGIPIAKLMSHSSRKHTSTKDLKDEEDYFKYAQKLFAEGIDYVIVGHSHKPIFKKFDNKCYINLGNWITDNSYAIMENGNISLKFWNA